MRERKVLIERVRRMRAMAEGVNSVEEAQVFATKAQQLMDEWRLTEFELDMADAAVELDSAYVDVGEGAGAGGFVVQRVDLGVVFGQPTMWRRALLGSIARANYGRSVNAIDKPVKGRNSYSYSIARQADQEFIAYMFKVVSDMLVAAAASDYKKYVVSGGREHKLRWMDSYYKGATAELGRRMRELVDEQRSRLSSKGTALVALLSDQLQKAVDARFAGELQPSPASLATSADGWWAGDEAAKSLTLQKGLSAGKPLQLH